jgi:hypothetical protein
MKPMMETHINAHVLARLMAKSAIDQELRSQCVRVTLVPPREIKERATAYLATHPEVWTEAVERARQIDEALARKASRRKERSRLAK